MNDIDAIRSILNQKHESLNESDVFSEIENNDEAVLQRLERLVLDLLDDGNDKVIYSRCAIWASSVRNRLKQYIKKNSTLDNKEELIKICNHISLFIEELAVLDSIKGMEFNHNK